MTPTLPTLDDVLAARTRIAPHAHRTPVHTSATLDAMSGAHLFFKVEALQRVGAFKFRGACNAVFSLSEAEASNGVATHSSGNHAQAVALAARLRGIAAHIVMPRDAPAVKRAAVEGYGARVYPCEPTLAARQTTLDAVVAKTGAAFVHPYDDPRVIAGQGTAGLELLEQAPGLDAIVVPVGGGGLASGTCLAAQGGTPAPRVFGVEPEAADDARRSLEAGRVVPSDDPVTIADGLRTSLSERTFAILRAHMERIVTVDEASIVRAMRTFWERTKLLIEPSSAVVVAALLEGTLPELRGARVGVILSGGNVDLGRLPWPSGT